MTRYILYSLAAVVAAFVGFQIFYLYTTYDSLSKVSLAYSFGPEDADLRVVEFIDYSCPFCKEIHPIITEAVKQDGKVHYFPMPLPSSNPESVYAATLAYAAGEQGKFIEMHNEIIENFGVMSDQTLSEISAKIDVDVVKLQQDALSKDMVEKIKENGRIFLKIGGSETPTFIFGKKTFFVPRNSMPTVEDFLTMFRNERAKKS